MYHCKRSAAIPFALALLALPGAARPLQGTPVNPVLAQGVFSNFAVGMTVGGTGAPGDLVIRAPGVNGGIPIQWSAGTFTSASATHPNYSYGALTTWAQGSSNPLPSFGGISTGGEVMPIVRWNGELDMAPMNWFMLSIGVAPNARGVAGSVLSMQTQNGTRNPAGDILSYYFIGSQGVNQALVDHSFLESSREQLKLNDIPTSAADRVIRNFDWGMGVLSSDPGARAGSMFPVKNCFYFTLTQAYVNSIPGLLLDGLPPSSSTVYAMTWTGAPLAWTAPKRAFTSLELFGAGKDGVVEIDALSVDKGSGSWELPSRAIVSLTLASNPSPGAAYDQLLVYQRGTTTLAQPLQTDHEHENPAQTFSQKIGLRLVADPTGGPDEVTGTCGGDPKEPYIIGPVVAIATDQPRTGAGTLGLSAMRTCPHDPNGNPDGDYETPTDDTLHIQVSGMNHSDDDSDYDLGFIQLFIEQRVYTGHGIPAAPTPWGEALWIDTTTEGRNTLDVSIPVPCTLLNETFRFSAKIYRVLFTPAPVAYQLRESCVLSIKK